MDKNGSAVDYRELEHIRASELQQEMQRQLEQVTDSSRIDSLRHTILRFVVDANYDKAHSELDHYVTQQESYPSFFSRTSSYVNYCHDVINAIRAKRSLPGLGGLSMSKHQELFEKVMEHFDELKHYLKKIQIVEKEVKLQDVRSTVWVLKVFFYCLFSLILFALAQDVIFGGLATTFNIVFDELTTKILDQVSTLF